MESLRVTAGAPGLTTLLGRATGLDAAASARFQERGGVGDGAPAVDVFVTTPFDCLAARRIEGEVSRDGAVVAAGDLLSALQEGRAAIGAARDANWPGALPPREGFAARDEVPVSVARQLADKGRELARQFSGPAGPPKSLLDSPVLTVDAESERPVEVPMRMIFTCTALGLIPGFAAPIDVPRHLRIATAGRWVRMDATFGTVYHSTGLGLFV